MRTIVRKFAVSVWREQFHRRRSELFLRLMKPQDGMSILDLGGGRGEFMGRIKDKVKARFVVSDILDYAALVKEKYQFDFVQIPEDGRLPFADKEFDIVLCNSVIEHVTMPKDQLGQRKISQAEWSMRAIERQRQFADEIRRIGKSYFVQTPHKHFPIEAHTLLPFVNWLDYNQTTAILHFANRWWAKGYNRVDWYLLNSREMRGFFPEGTIHIERFLGLPKSIIAYRQPDYSSPLGSVREGKSSVG